MTKTKEEVPLSQTELLAVVSRKMILRDWHLRLTFDEAEALRAWVIQHLDDEEKRRLPKKS